MVIKRIKYFNLFKNLVSNLKIKRPTRYFFFRYTRHVFKVFTLPRLFCHKNRLKDIMLKPVIIHSKNWEILIQQRPWIVLASLNFFTSKILTIHQTNNIDLLI